MIEIRKALAGDLKAVADLWEYAFRDGEAFVNWYFKNYASTDEIYLAERQGKLLAAAQSIRRTWKHRDTTLQTRYIVGVSTYPEARGAGIVQSLMQKIHVDAKEEDVPFTILMPFEASFYLPYGYYWCDNHLQIETPLAQLPKLSHSSGTFKRTTVTEEIRQLYRQFLEQYQTDGLLREERFWQSFYDDLMLESGYLYLYENAQNEPTGYVAYLMQDSSLVVREIVYLDQDAQSAIYGFLRGHRSQVKNISWSAPIWEKAAHDQAYDKHTVAFAPFMMARIEDITPFLQQPSPMRISFTIEADQMTPESHWVLEGLTMKASDENTDFTISRENLAYLAFTHDPLHVRLHLAASSVRNRTAWETFVELFAVNNVYTNAYF